MSLRVLDCLHLYLYLHMFLSTRPLFSQVKKMKTRKGMCFAPGHTADVGWSLGGGPHSSPDPQHKVLLPKLHFLSTRLWWTHPSPPEYPNLCSEEMTYPKGNGQSSTMSAEGKNVTLF